MRVALVHHWLVGMAGGEKVLEAICRIYPEADIFTHVLDRSRISPYLASRNISTTFIAKLPFAAKFYQFYLPFMPAALDHLDLTSYDLVISIESGPAKGVVTRADSCHICYCNSPMRYIWDFWPQYKANAGALKKLGMAVFLPYLRRADVLSSFRVDHFTANSHIVADRIKKHWRRDSTVIYPPVNVKAFQPRSNAGGEYYICVGRLESYKRVDLAVRACTRLGRKLVVVGAGTEFDNLKELAGDTVTFMGRLDDKTLARVMAGARALIFPGEEDFGIVPVEAMACGMPVIAYGAGGVTETVVKGESGLFFNQQDVESLCAALEDFENREKDFDPVKIRARAEEFSEEKFSSAFQEFVERNLSERRTKHS